MAEPHLGNAVEFAEVLDLSRFPNCYMKLSGLNHFAQDAPHYEGALAFTRRVVQEFGPDKVIWGSETPKIVDVHMQGYSAKEIAMVKGGNIRRLLNWK
ncbi:MAG: amidohydrolase family protein [Saprospiraceae bacterium]|nr:amidohydrolase family protein [Saprospiraceae bacterium]